MDGLPIGEKFRSENFAAFSLGLVLFSLASSLFFTPLPIFFAKDLAFPTSLVFMIYMLSSWRISCRILPRLERDQHLLTQKPT